MDLNGQPKKKKKKKKDKNEKKSGATYRRKKKTMFDQVLGLFGMASGNVALTEPRALEAAQALDLQTSHLRKLKFSFDRVDIDGSGAIDADEYFGSIGERRSPFTDKLFSLIDLDGNGTIDFNEFVRVLATYCMFTKDEILRFCFECFDVDSSGTIDEKEFIELCKVVNNAAPAFPANFKRALQEFDVNEDGLIDYAEFLELDRRYPLVLFPAFRMQDRMQQMSLGEVCDAMLHAMFMSCRLVYRRHMLDDAPLSPTLIPSTHHTHSLSHTHSRWAGCQSLRTTPNWPR